MATAASDATKTAAEALDTHNYGAPSPADIRSRLKALNKDAVGTKREPTFGSVMNPRPGWRYFVLHTEAIPNRGTGKVPPQELEQERHRLRQRAYEPERTRVDDAGNPLPEEPYVYGAPTAELWRIPTEVWDAQRAQSVDLNMADPVWVEIQKCRSRPGAGFLPRPTR